MSTLATPLSIAGTRQSGASVRTQNVVQEDVEQLMKHEKAESHEAKCLRACVLKKFEILDDAGKLSKKHTVEMIKAMTEHEEEKAEVVEEVAEHCEAIEVPEDHCDAAETYQNCIYEQLKEHGIDLKH